MSLPRSRRPASPRAAAAPFLSAAAIAALSCAGRAAAPPAAPPAPAATPGAADAADLDTSFLEAYAATRGFSLGRPNAVRVTPDGKAVLFLRGGPRSPVQDLYQHDVETGRERLLASAESLLGGADETLTAEERARRERMRLAARGIAGYDLSRDGARVLVPLSGRLFVVDRAGGPVRELPAEGGAPIDARFSPDGRAVACVREGEVFVIDVETGAQRRVTAGAGGTVSHGLSEFVAQEEMGRMQGYWWSPDSRRIAYQRTDTAGVEVLHLGDPIDPARPPQAFPYPRAGGRNADVRLGIVPAAGGDTVWVEWDRARYPYLATVRWDEGAPLTLVVQDRAQTEAAVLLVAADTGAWRVLHVERDQAWLNLDQAVPRWLRDASAFLWTSERGGAWQLELRGRDGSLARTLTPASFGLMGLVHVDDPRGEAVVVASPDPTERHLWRVPLDPAMGAPRRLTETAGVHAAAFAREAPVWVQFERNREGADAAVIRRGGQPAGELRSAAEQPPFLPRVQWTRTDTDPPLHAAIVWPRRFDPALAYPAVVHVYGGPHGQMVTADRRRYLIDQWIADQGFVVLLIDGRGTPGRGRAFERAVRGNLIELPLADQAAGVRALAARTPPVDGARVGIFGWSFGGYASALAAMRRPDVFAAAVAGAPVTDWRDYDTHYTERYMGLPGDNPEGYRDASALTWAAQLSRPLLIVHGTADDNVWFLHSLKLADALFRAGRPFDMLPLSGLTHMVPDPVVTSRLYARIVTFFRAHLGEPRPRPR